MGFQILKQFVPAQPVKRIALKVFSAPDGRPYFALKRAAPGMKVGTAMVLSQVDGGRPRGFKTDLWIDRNGELVLGGYMCPSCHRRLRGSECGCGHKATQIHIPLYKKDRAGKLLKDPATEELVAGALKMQAGPAPLAKMGVVRQGNGLLAMNKSAGRPPLKGLPEGADDAALYLSDRLNRDVVPEGDEHEEMILIPLSPSLVVTDEERLEEAGVTLLL